MNPLYRIITVVTFALIIVWSIATAFNKLLLRQELHDNQRLSEIFENTTPYDILFIGSSRTHRSVYPKIIDSICGVSSFNAGIEAGAIPDFKLMLDGYLIHHPPPAILVLTIDLPSFSTGIKIQKYPQYYPFLNNKGVLNNILASGYGVYLTKLFPFLSITDQDDYTKEMIIQVVRGRDATDLSAGDFEYKGFISNGDAYIKKPELEKVIKRMNINSESVRYLHAMINECKEKNIKIIFTYAPEYDFHLQKTRTNTDSVFRLIYQIARQNNIPVLRDDSLSICQSPQYFANNGHLNKQGAIVYSAILAEEMKKAISQTKDPSH
jgi:hypothetical protein